MANKLEFEEGITEKCLTNNSSIEKVNITQTHKGYPENVIILGNRKVNNGIDENCDQNSIDAIKSHRILEIDNNTLNHSDNYQDNTDKVDKNGIDNKQSNSIDIVISKTTNNGENKSTSEEDNCYIKSKMDIDENNATKVKKISSEMELVGINKMEETSNSFDVFGDGDNVCNRKYKKRKTEQPVSYKEPPVIPRKPSKPPKHCNSSDSKPISLTCPVCKKPFKSQNRLTFHLKLHRKKFKCTVCSKKFNKHENLIAHKSKHKKEKKPKKKREPVLLPCNMCDRVFKRNKSHNVHMKKHLQGIVQQYKCLLCSASFNKNADLVAHKSTHNSESFLCEQCKVAFSEHSDFLVHNLNNHTKATQIKCPECGLTYPKHTYKVHILTHFKKKLNCPICPFVANGDHYLQNHINRHRHTRTCIECGKVCSNKGMLEYHMVSHTGVKIHQCYYCGKGFALRGQRNVHARIHTGEKKFTCNICGFKALQSSTLKRHIMTHGRERERYSCDRCDRTYFRKDYLEKHKQFHDQKIHLFECPECDSAFQTLAGLKNHATFKHSNERPVECKVCNARFLNNNRLLQHNRTKYHIRNMYGSKKTKENDC